MGDGPGTARLHIIVTWETVPGPPHVSAIWERALQPLGRQAWDRECAYNCYLGGWPRTASLHLHLADGPGSELAYNCHLGDRPVTASPRVLVTWGPGLGPQVCIFLGLGRRAVDRNTDRRQLPALPESLVKNVQHATKTI